MSTEPMTPFDLQNHLEELLDTHGTQMLFELLADVLLEKADHAMSSYNNRDLSRALREFGGDVGRLAAKAERDLPQPK